MSALERVLGVFLFAALSAQAEQIAIVVSPQAPIPTHTAAHELESHLAAIYPADRFTIVPAAPVSGKVISFAQPAPNNPEDFTVTHTARSATIAGPPLNAVYALLEKLGWGFYLSYEASPPV